MKTVAEWPRPMFRCRREDWHLAGSTPSTGGVFGPGTAIHTENRVWRVTADLTALRPDEWRQVRAFLDLARGRFEALRIPVITGTAQAGALAPLTFDTGRIFDTGVQWAAETLDGVTVAEAAPAGATMIRMTLGPALLHHSAMFSLPGDRIYRVTGRSASRVRFEPPLRAAARIGDAVEFMAPWARMRLDVDDASLSRVRGPLTAPEAIPLVEAVS